MPLQTISTLIDVFIMPGARISLGGPPYFLISGVLGKDTMSQYSSQTLGMREGDLVWSVARQILKENLKEQTAEVVLRNKRRKI